jgi:hypothetical protein
MTRSRAVEIQFVESDDPRILQRMDEIAAGGVGWINFAPVIDEEYEPAPPGPFAFLGGSTHQVPICTWMPGKRSADGTTKPTTIGLQHASGPRVASRLAGLECPLHEGWRVSQDHPRRGLVATVPANTDNRTVLEWLLRAASLVCAVPSTGRWTAAVHTGSEAGSGVST